MFVFPQFYGSWYLACALQLWEACSTLKLEVNGLPMRKHLKKKGIIDRGECEVGQKPRIKTFEAHVKKVENDFWKKRFKVYKRWKERWFDDYSEKGYFDTLTGFRIQGVLSRNDVINYPVQGSAFHCLLWTLIQAQKQIKKNKFSALITGQIHDSIFSDVPKNELNDYLDMLVDIGTRQIRKHWKWIIIPLELEAGVTDTTWYHKKEWIRLNSNWKLKPKKKDN